MSDMTYEKPAKESPNTIARLAIIRLLDRHNIDYSCWGYDGSKAVDQLVEELLQQESVLEIRGDMLVRRVDGVAVDVFAEVNGQYYKLVEDRQEYRSDGAVRRRELSTSLGEKMRTGEDALMVMVRALQEELGIAVDQAEFQVGDTSRVLEPSKAFPGLMIDRGLTYGVIMIGEHDFVAYGYKEVQPTKTVYFVWEPVDVGMFITSDALKPN